MRQTPAYTVDVERVVSTATSRTSDDTALVLEASRGNREAFAGLIEPRATRLLRTARVILGNEADAYEAAQETLIAAWVQLPGLRDANRFDAWLNRTLVNKCRDALRRRRRVVEIDLGGVEIEQPDHATAHAEQDRILAAFDRLAVHERHILVLHHLHELPLAQIAAQLQIPVGTAKSRLWSARRALERALENDR